MFDPRAVEADFSDASGRYGERASLQARIGAMLITSALPYVNDDMLLLDVGAGPGDVTLAWPGRKIALDAAFGMCAEARKKGLPSLHARAETLPLRNEAVDMVVSNLMLQWLPATERFFGEAERILKPGGLLAVANFAQGTLAELSKAFAAAGEKHRVSDFVASAELVKKIEAAGFEVIVEQHETITEHYADLPDLCAYLRAIGANNKRLNRPRGMLTMRKLREVAMVYPREAAGIPASWEVQTVIARKI
jgi:malonyl-CoA O-methyltransferase